MLQLFLVRINVQCMGYHNYYTPIINVYVDETSSRDNIGENQTKEGHGSVEGEMNK